MTKAHISANPNPNPNFNLDLDKSKSKSRQRDKISTARSTCKEWRSRRRPPSSCFVTSFLGTQVRDDDVGDGDDDVGDGGDDVGDGDDDDAVLVLCSLESQVGFLTCCQCC